tara:strand:+ start:1703 stop:2746 length:1044 start_codon:yes stop_codon:yes gene_type:complete
MGRLEGTLKYYDWGSKFALAKFRGVEPSGKPEAELWFDSERDSPWLVKVLAIKKPLSIQVHPNAEQAEEGFINEEVNKVPIDGFKRSFKDRNPKSELVCAISQFKAFSGFREIDSAIDAAHVFSLSKDSIYLLKKDGNTAWRKVVEEILLGKWDDLLEKFLITCRNINDVKWVSTAEAILQFAEIYKNDSSILLLPFLRYHELEPGDALHVESGVIHTYFSGMAVEIMNPGDNVLRAGMTNKYIDCSRFIEVFNPEIKPSEVQKAMGADHFYEGPMKKIEVRKLQDVEVFLTDSKGVDLLISTNGSARVKNNKEIFIESGEAFEFAEEENSYTISVQGEAYLIRGLT